MSSITWTSLILCIDIRGVDPVLKVGDGGPILYIHITYMYVISMYVYNIYILYNI